jgi:hypothetical protein|nr:MAG TPA: hypothetical protein [Caudoviricetes sp.]
MWIIRNKLIPFGNYKAFNFIGLILFVKDKAYMDDFDINHEKIHSRQILEMLIIGFYLWYVIEYLLICIFGNYSKQSQRYHDVSFEEEAYQNMYNLEYLKNRKWYSWTKYLKIGSYE